MYSEQDSTGNIANLERITTPTVGWAPNEEAASITAEGYIKQEPRPRLSKRAKVRIGNMVAELRRTQPYLSRREIIKLVEAKI